MIIEKLVRRCRGQLYFIYVFTYIKDVSILSFLISTIKNITL